MNAVLELIEKDTCFSRLSLREVTRQAGIVPAGFYRHFKDMEALGLAMVDSVEEILRHSIRQTRTAGFDRLNAFEDLILFWLDTFRSYRTLFTFLVREAFGGSQAIRVKIRMIREKAIIELASDMSRIKEFCHLSEPARLLLAELMVRTISTTLSEMNKSADLVKPEKLEPEKRCVQQLRFIGHGAMRLTDDLFCLGSVAH